MCTAPANAKRFTHLRYVLLVDAIPFERRDHCKYITLTRTHTGWRSHCLARWRDGNESTCAHFTYTHTLTSTTWSRGRELATQNWNHISHISTQA